MIVSPEMLKSSSSSVAPIPTVVPGPSIHYVEAGDTGNRTLWLVFSALPSSNLLTAHRVVCVIMGISSLAFYGMAFRVPVVSELLCHMNRGTNDSK